jgi:cysteine synthase A
LIKTEGLFLGTSCGVNVAGAIEMAKEMGPGKNIVTILCDDAYKYFSKMFNKEFLQSKNLPIPDWI